MALVTLVENILNYLSICFNLEMVHIENNVKKASTSTDTHLLKLMAE